MSSCQHLYETYQCVILSYYNWLFNFVITGLIEYATEKYMSLTIVCSFGKTCMQERTLSLMQMAKISSIL